ncbi:MAG: hypothetical protein PHQ40_12325 [Anaerolineaceae bacterium]|nr:hypothetical protein [Anaerolineaceae bacterium]
MIRSKRTTSFLLALVLVLSSVTVAQAVNYIPGTDIPAYTNNEAYWHGEVGYFDTASESLTDGRAIYRLGWSVRTNQQVCGGTVVYGYPLSPTLVYNASYAYVGPAQSRSDLKPCPYGGNRVIQVAVRHQYTATSGSADYFQNGVGLLDIPDNP